MDSDELKKLPGIKEKLIKWGGGEEELGYKRKGIDDLIKWKISGIILNLITFLTTILAFFTVTSQMENNKKRRNFILPYAAMHINNMYILNFSMCVFTKCIQWSWMEYNNFITFCIEDLLHGDFPYNYIGVLQISFTNITNGVIGRSKNRQN